MSRSVFERVLVTGGTGFIGRYVLERLIRAGIRPLVTVRRNPHELSNNFDTVHLDLTEQGRIDEVVKAYRPQVVIHLAGVIGSNDPGGELCHAVNTIGTRSLLTALDHAGCDRVVMVGSAAEYGSQKIPFREDMQPMPITSYGRSKAEATRLALRMFDATGFPVTVLRVFSAYGPGQPEKMFLPQAINHALSGKRFVINDGSKSRDHVYVEDVADAIVSTLNTDAAVGKVVNIGSGKAVPLTYLAEKVWEICGADRGLLTVGDPSRDADPQIHTQADVTLAKGLLNWSPDTPLFDDIGHSGGLSRMMPQMGQSQ